MENRKHTIVHGPTTISTRKKERNDMPWWIWIFVGLAGLAGLTRLVVLLLRAYRKKHSNQKPINPDGYISDDEIQAIKIIRELSRLYEDVEERRTK